jgi:exonuclease III
MSILSWNYHGLGQPQTVQELVRLVHTTAPKIVFISETRQHRDRVSNIKGRLDMNNCFVVDGVGKGGGMALYWKDEIKIQLLSYRLHHIDTLVWDGVHYAAWRATFVYGEPQVHERDKMWELMR